MEFEKINIEELLPQRKPFIMVDRLVHLDHVSTVSSIKIVTNNMFTENGFLTEAGIIENIAQTCALRLGYINKYILSDEVKLGFIGAIKNLVIAQLPKIGDELKTTVDIVNEVFTLTLVNAKVEVDNRLIASCEMKISITDINSYTNA
jgi:3-hydroxymyristoyl/3-hydroxydecanoyl-(acyl carrier protein) dehydratase